MEKESNNFKKLNLFVQEGCRPCMYLEKLLDKVENWHKIIDIVDAKENGVWSDYAKKCGVTLTPSLVAFQENGDVKAITCGTENISIELLENLVKILYKS